MNDEKRNSAGMRVSGSLGHGTLDQVQSVYIHDISYCKFVCSISSYIADFLFSGDGHY